MQAPDGPARFAGKAAPAWMCADQPACARGAGDLQAARAAAGLDQQSRRASLPRRENQPAGGGEVAGAREPGHFCQNRIEPRTAQTLLHRPERAAGIAGAQHDDAGGIEGPSRHIASRHHGDPLRIGGPVLGPGTLLLDPEHRPAAIEPQSQRKGETVRCAAIAGFLGQNLVQRPPGKTAAEHRIHRIMIEGRVVAGPGRLRMRLPISLAESLHRPPQHAPRPQLREGLHGRCGVVAGATIRWRSGRGGGVPDHESVSQSAF
jgi:hypothetical protein